jgi:hypothetical protein
MKVEKFKGEIRVASRIIDYLSSGLYSSPAACLKELVNNSYDADATLAEVFVKPDADRIIISDNGSGMNRAEFEKHFQRISESHKRDGAEITTLRRPPIGKIGIGFIAANEICEIMEIYSTKARSRDLLHVTIDFAEMRKPVEERRRGKNGDIVKADYEGEVLEAEAPQHYTQIFLTQVRGEAKAILAGATVGYGRPQSLYGLSAESVLKRLSDPSLSSWKQFDEYSETMLKVGLNVPVKYFEDAFPTSCKKVVEPFVRETEKLKFAVSYDGTDLRKPIVLHPGKKRAFCRDFTFSGNNVSAKGYFYVQHGTIKPQSLHGLLVRIRHAAVGEYDSSFWGFSPSESSILQRWVSAEIWADDRLEEAMNIDRSTLREAHPAYVELRSALHKALRQILTLARSQLYEKANIDRTKERTSTTLSQIEAVAQRLDGEGATKAANAIRNAWQSAPTTKADQKRTVKRYTVAEIYDVVVAAVEDEVDARTFNAIMKKLSEILAEG